MRMIPEWRRAWRMFSQQAFVLATALQGVWVTLDGTQRMAAQIEYEADTWERGNVFLQSMWSQLGGTEEQLDDLFRTAVTL